MDNNSIVICDECGKGISIEKSSIKKMLKIGTDDRTYLVTFFVCKECGKHYIISVDDKSTIDKKCEYIKKSEKIIIEKQKYNKSKKKIRSKKEEAFIKSYEETIGEIDKLKHELINMQNELKCKISW